MIWLASLSASAVILGLRHCTSFDFCVRAYQERHGLQRVCSEQQYVSAVRLLLNDCDHCLSAAIYGAVRTFVLPTLTPGTTLYNRHVPLRTCTKFCLQKEADRHA